MHTRQHVYFVAIVAGLLAAGSAPASAVATTEEIGTVLVVGATGQQGGAVARELLRRGHQVHGLTRNPDSRRAQALAAAGATMLRGDLDDPASLTAALDGVDGVFLMTSFWEHGYDGEVRHGRHMIEAAEAAGVRHLVYSSVGSADRETGIPHFDSKYDVEILLAASDLSWTVLRPVSFMENWSGGRAELGGGRYETPLGPDAIVQHVSVQDIGRFAAEAFESPDAWRGVALDIAGDSRTVVEMGRLFEQVLERPIEYVNVPWPDYEAAAGEEMTVMMRWFDEIAYDVDVSALRERHPWMVRMEDYLRQAWDDEP